MVLLRLHYFWWNSVDIQVFTLLTSPSSCLLRLAYSLHTLVDSELYWYNTGITGLETIGYVPEAESMKFTDTQQLLVFMNICVTPKRDRSIWLLQATSLSIPSMWKSHVEIKAVLILCLHVHYNLVHWLYSPICSRDGDWPPLNKHANNNIINLSLETSILGILQAIIGVLQCVSREHTVNKQQMVWVLARFPPHTNGHMYAFTCANESY